MVVEMVRHSGGGRSILYVTAAALALVTAAMVVRVAFDPQLSALPRIGSSLDPTFSLIDQNGVPFTNATLAGKPRLLIFGYTSCPDICPTSLASLAETMRQLGAEAAKLRFIFMTVDPARDTPARLKSYLAAFSSRIIGLTGGSAAMSAALDGYHVLRGRTDNSDSSMDHTSTVFLISRDGRLQDTIRERELGTASALAKIRRLVAD
jgi:protein SCO1